ISYPTECRAVGVSWMHGIGRLGAIFGAFTGSLIFQFSFSLGEILLILSVPTFIAFLGLNLQSDRHNNKAEIVT
ncbi:MFS transporter, partial [Acinetobacter baumannii]